MCDCCDFCWQLSFSSCFMQKCAALSLFSKMTSNWSLWLWDGFLWLQFSLKRRDTHRFPEAPSRETERSESQAEEKTEKHSGSRGLNIILVSNIYIRADKNDKKPQNNLFYSTWSHEYYNTPSDWIIIWLLLRWMKERNLNRVPFTPENFKPTTLSETDFLINTSSTKSALRAVMKRLTVHWTHSLLLDSHLSLQQLWHVAHSQNHVGHSGLQTHTRWPINKAQKQTVSEPRPPLYLHQRLHLVQKYGLVAELHERLGDAQGERSQPGPVPPNQNQSLHPSAVSNSNPMRDSSWIRRCSSLRNRNDHYWWKCFPKAWQHQIWSSDFKSSCLY